eukprot:364623-Chlamydomonas_euryale.AAC.8
MCTCLAGEESLHMPCARCARGQMAVGMMCTWPFAWPLKTAGCSNNLVYGRCSVMSRAARNFPHPPSSTVRPWVVGGYETSLDRREQQREGD